jgi:uncharacterized protein (TIRG00374 family)
VTPAEKTFIRRPPADAEEETPEVAGGVSAGGGGDGAALPFFTPKRAAQTGVVVALVVVAIYLIIPEVADLGSAFDKLGEADEAWIAVAVAFELVAFGTYVALFRGVVGGDVVPLTWREAYEINMAGLAASRLLSGGGAGGIALTYWALRKAGMEARDSARRMVAFLALQYIFYPLALIIFGVLLRTGVLPGDNALELTVIPAAIAGVVLILGLLSAFIPPDFDRRIGRLAHGQRRTKWARRLAAIPATVGDGMRMAFDLIAHPSRGGLAVAGAVGFWAANIAILWASFKAFGVSVPFAVIVQGFFLGMVANLVPFAPAGVGAVDAGMIGAFFLFGLPHAEVFAAVLIYRVVAFWLPLVPGIIAFFQLRKTVQRWEQEGRPAETGESQIPVPATG